MGPRLDITGRLQRRMLEIISTALPLITKSLHDADLGGLAHLRDEMVDAIEAYRLHADRLRGREGESLCRGYAEVAAAYDGFRARWEHRRAAENWHEYRLSAVVMMKRVRGHVEQAEAMRDMRQRGDTGEAGGRPAGDA